MLKGSWLVGRRCHRQLVTLVGGVGALPLALTLACGDDQGGTGKTRENPGLNTQQEDGGETSRDGAVGNGVLDGGETNANGESSAVGSNSANSTASVTTTVGVTSVETTAPSMTTTPTAPSTTSPTMTTSAPDPWDDVEPPFPGLANCRERSIGTEDQCLHELRCSTRSYDSNCVKGEGDTWNCSCLDWSGNRTERYVLEGADAESACKVGLPFCVAGQEPEVSEPTCSIRDVETSQSFCRRSEVCSSTAQLGSGVVAHFEDERPVNACSDYGDSMSCQCNGEYQRHNVYGVDGTESCDLLLDICEGVTPISEELVCDDASLYVSQTYCSFSQTCGARTELDTEAGVYSITRLGTTTSQCGLYEGVQSCSCTGPEYQYFSLEVESLSLGDACRASGSVCTSRETLVATEPADCVDVTTVASGPTCTMSARCSVAVSRNDSILKVYGPLGAGCSKSGDDWACTCRSGANVGEAFTVSGNDGIDACNDASTYCARSVIELEFVSFGYSQFVFGVPPTVGVDAGAP